MMMSVEASGPRREVAYGHAASSEQTQAVSMSENELHGLNVRIKTAVAPQAYKLMLPQCDLQHYVSV